MWILTQSRKLFSWKLLLLILLCPKLILATNVACVVNKNHTQLVLRWLFWSSSRGKMIYLTPLGRFLPVYLLDAHVHKKQTRKLVNAIRNQSGRCLYLARIWHAEGGAQFDFNYRHGFLLIPYSQIFFSQNPSYDELAKYTACENFPLYGNI